jgi:hypothetical protein
MRPLPCALAALALAACHAPRPPALWGERGAAPVRLAFDARGLDALRVDGGAGRVRVTADSAAAGDSVRATVTLRSTDARRLAEVCVPGATLDSARGGGELRLAVRQPGRDRCGEEWVVEVPARLAVRLEFAAATLDVTGVAGGLRARVSAAGDVRAAVAGGAVDVETNVGDARVASSATRYGDVDLRSEVGSVALWLLGHRIPTRGRPGSGDEVRLAGEGGGPTVRVRVRVGRAEARLGG